MFSRTGGIPSINNSSNNATATSQSKNNTLVATAFHTSLDNLLIEATRHRTMSPLRDAVQSARLRGFSAEDIFHTFVLACDILHGRRQYRALLLQSLSDLGKMASLRLLPITGNVLHVICHLVRKLLGSGNGSSSSSNGNNTNANNTAAVSASNNNCNNQYFLQSGLQSTNLRGMSGFESLTASVSLEGTLNIDMDVCEGSSPSVQASITTAGGGNITGGNPSNESSETLLLLDEEMRMRILQMLMAYLSACALGNTALADMMGILFTIYLQAAEGSMVEATCAATIEQRTQAVLRSLRSSSSNNNNREKSPSGNTQVEDDNASLGAQIQSVAYVKDVCNICAGSTPKWLKLGSYRSGSIAISTPSSTAEPSTALPRRLRILLLQTLIAHFTDSEPITSAQQLSIFFAQCINEDVVSLVLGHGRSNRGSPQYDPIPIKQQQVQQKREGEAGENLVDLYPTLEDHHDEEEFYLTQKLGVTVLTRALPVMRHTMPTLLRYHVMLVKLCSEGDVDGEDARRMAIVLTLWRRAIADHQLLRQLLLSPSLNSGVGVVGGGLEIQDSILFTTSSSPSGIPLRTQKEKQQQQQQQKGDHEEDEDDESHGNSSGEFYPERSRVIRADYSPELEPIAVEDMDGTRPFADLVTAAAQLLASIIATTEGMLNIDTVARREEKKRTTTATTSSLQRSIVARDLSRPLQLSMTIAHQSQMHGTASATSPSQQPQQSIHRETSLHSLSDKTSTYDLEDLHPATRQTNDVLAFLTMFAQSFAGIVEEIDVPEKTPTRTLRPTTPTTTTTTNSTTIITSASNLQKEATSLFLSLHPPLLRSFALATQHLQGDDVIHTILKGCTHLLKVSCILGLPAQRDGYLQIFLSRLHMEKDPQTQQRLDRTITSQQRRKNPTLDERGLLKIGGRSPGATTSSLKSVDAMQRSLNGLQQKLYVLNCVISIANSMGSVLGEGWRPIASCLLLVEPLLQDFYRVVEQQLQPQQQQQQQKEGMIEEMTLQDVVRNANHVRDALHLLFINTALAHDTTALEGLLVHFVAEVCGTPTNNNNNSKKKSESYTYNTNSIKGDSLLSLKMASECCALAILTAAGRRADPLPLQRLLRLWAAVHPLFRHALLNPQHYYYYCYRSNQHHQHRNVEVVLQTMERLVEDVAVIAAQFCRRVNKSPGGNNNNNRQDTSNTSNTNSANSGLSSSGNKGKEEVAVSQLSVGPYSTAAVVLRFMSLCPLPVQTQRDIGSTRAPHTSTESSCDGKNEVVIEESEELKQQLLALPLELMATVFDHMQEIPQEQQEEEQKEQKRKGKKEKENDNNNNNNNDNNNNNNNNSEEEKKSPHGGSGSSNNSEVLQTIARGVSLALLKEVLKLVQGFGEELRGSAWVHLLQLLRCTALLPQQNPVATLLANTKPQPTHGAVNVSGKQGIGIAFRALETIQHSCITSLDDEGLRQLFRCGGAFMTHSLSSTEQRLNINLSAVQLLWSIADYVVSREKDSERNDDILWCTLFLQLYDGCLDVRPEVRQSALKTLFSLVQAYGGRFSADCWRCVLQSVLGSLMDITMQAATACAIPSPPKTSRNATGINASMMGTAPPNSTIITTTTTTTTNSGGGGEEELVLQRSGYVPLASGRDSLLSQHRRCGSSASASTLFSDAMHLLQGYDGEEERRIATLLTHLSEHPAFFDDMRITIMDAVCRVFVSHHRAMHTALIMQKGEPQQRLENEALLHDVISLFIEVCAGVRMVARTTSGETAALSAVRALHALMAATDVILLTEAELETAWFALEKIVRRDSDCMHTARKQCTAAVVSAIVTSLGDVVSMRLMGLQKIHQNQQQQQSVGLVLPSANTAFSASSSSSSFFDHLRHAITPASVRFRRRSSCISSSCNNGRPRHSYFVEYHHLIQEALHSFAVTDSYFFPSKVQTAVIGAWKMLWPLLNGSEQNSVVELVLQQFPARHALQAFVTQHVAFSGGGSLLAESGSSSAEVFTRQSSQQIQSQRRRAQPVTLQESVPPGAHPSFLLMLMDFLLLIASDNGLHGDEEEKGNEPQPYQQQWQLQQQQHSELVIRMTPVVIRLAGALLLLEYAPSEVLATPGPGAPFHIPADFFEKTENCLRFFLLVVLWDMPLTSVLETQTPSSVMTTNINRSKVAPVLLSSSRHDGLLGFVTTFTALVSLASTMLNNVEARKSSGFTVSDLPVHLQHALQRLEGLVILLSKLIPHVIRSSGDVSAATELLSVLVPTSSVESPFFAGVARRSLDVLRRWSVSSSPLVTDTPLVSAGTGLVYDNVVLSQQRQQQQQQQQCRYEQQSSELGTMTSMDVLEASSGKESVRTHAEDEEVSSMLQSVARASMGARNRAVLRRFLLNNNNPEARQMAKTTLQTLVLLYPTLTQPQDPRQQQQQQHQRSVAASERGESVEVTSSYDNDKEEDENTETLQGILVELVRLVEYTGNDAEFRTLLSRAMLGICAALGFSQTASN
ncbi:Mon2 [Trypanosoma melophagium]|uniref:Mon2 n=1 Tax=Trypanosoma melophagium TaxID=715481 RepID=UPI00351AAA88|nr:Mon2 [Trypanosoma melophagium]